MGRSVTDSLLIIPFGLALVATYFKVRDMIALIRATLAAVASIFVFVGAAFALQ